MIINFGINFDNGVFPRPSTEGGVCYIGEKGLLKILEGQMGLEGHDSKVEHLRTEQYRQALSRYLKNNATVFYRRSFEADQLACADALLKRRDELLLAGWNFIPHDCPPRLKVIADIENLFLTDDKGNSKLIAGYADRFNAVFNRFKNKKIGFNKFVLHTPFELLPPQLKRLFSLFSFEICTFDGTIQGDSDLNIFKKFINNELQRGEKQELKCDGSLVILESERDIESATILAKILGKNPDFKPVFLIPDKNRTLDEALIQEGLPAFGLPSASLGRPTLQLLKLITTFIWRPLDPYKILEFVTLPSKPLDGDLATVIANVMSQRPGIGSDIWFYEVNRFFENLEEKAAIDPSVEPQKIKREYEFWFDRTTYDIAKSAPKDEIISLFSYLKEWAIKEFESYPKNTSLLVLSEQARRIEEFLNELPPSENFLTALELERIIRTIYEPAPVQPKPQEIGHFEHITHGDCLLKPVNQLIWWNFTDTEGVHFFSRWYAEETDWLKNKNVLLQSPQEENALMLWQRVQPVSRAAKQLILIYPKKVNGENTTEHPLISHLRACFCDLNKIIVHTEHNLRDFQSLTHLKIPQFINLEYHKLGKIKPFIQLNSTLLSQREQETLTSLESLFYYPHQWVFRHKARLSKSAILSIVKENTLKGNLAHRFFELVLKEDFTNWDKNAVDKWVDEHSRRLFTREAATLLMYGFEPDRVQFITQVKYAIWTLINLVRNNKWTVEATEKDLAGQFSNIPVKGKADIVLKRATTEGGNEEQCVLDLKWSGHGYRERLIKNGEDLQLVMYSRLLTPDENWAHTAYFIIDNARLLARNTLAFNEIKALMPDIDSFAMNEMIWVKMLKTFEWRLTQITSGTLEIRTASTADRLEEEYGAALLDVLEMKKEDAKFDDYRTLIGLIN